MMGDIKRIEDGFDLVFVARAGVENMGFNDLKQRVGELLLSASARGNLKISPKLDNKSDNIGL